MHWRVVFCAPVLSPQAVLKFNLQRVLSDPTGEQDRPLVVRRANMRKPASAMMMGASGLQAAAAAGLSANSAFSSGSNVGAGGHMSMSMGSGALSAMDMQQQGSLSQMGLGAPEMPFYVQPYMAMQVRGYYWVVSARVWTASAGNEVAWPAALLRCQHSARLAGHACHAVRVMLCLAWLCAALPCLSTSNC